MYWYQKARVNWLNLGDNNTKFFHQTTRQMRQKNKILRIKGDDNNWIEKEEGIIGKFEDFFKQLFCTRGVKKWGDILDEVPQLLNESMNVELVKKVIEEEVSNAVFLVGCIQGTRSRWL